MKKVVMSAVAGLMVFSSAACGGGGSVDAQCTMPPKIDKGKTYRIKFVTESRMYQYKVLDVKNCWIKIDQDPIPYWYPTSDIAVITSKPEPRNN